jgi:hypothetical protein
MGVDATHAPSAGAERSAAEMVEAEGPEVRHSAVVAEAETRHSAAVVAAETRRLQRRLRAYGPMPRARLAEISGSRGWREGTFEQAVKEGIRSGKLEQLPLGWLKGTDR